MLHQKNAPVDMSSQTLKVSFNDNCDQVIKTYHAPQPTNVAWTFRKIATLFSLITA